jgi:hypothetical protein
VARVAIAAERHRLAHGQAPASLADLTLAAAEVLDPFTGRSLLYTASSTGFTVYSVGANSRDDGGQFTPPAVKGAAPGFGVAQDIGVAVRR